MSVTADDVRAFCATLPRAYEVFVRQRWKWRVGRIVFVAFSRDERLMGFGFPKDERDAIIAGAPDTFVLPRPADLRYNWLVARLDQIDHTEMAELVLDAWRMVVPKKIAAERGDGLMVSGPD
jgi:hypothetical protein